MKLLIYRGWTSSVVVDFDGEDVSASTFAADIRTERRPTAALIASFTVDMAGAATGTVTLRLDNSVTANIKARTGWFDIKRTTGGEPGNVLERPIEVEFVDIVTP